MTGVLHVLNAVVWGAPALILILGVGLFLTLRLGAVQLKLFPAAWRDFCGKLIRKPETGDSSYQALCTALAATVGTGNLAGVAGAICLGGPGAIFWMWLCGILGMVTKFAEAVLAVRFRKKQGDGYSGGPMYVMETGLGERWKPMAVLYCIFGIGAAFGVGNAAQVNAVIAGVRSIWLCFGRDPGQQLSILTGLVLALLVGLLLFGGADRIGSAAEGLVPIAAGGYILLCAAVLVLRVREIPGAFVKILQGAFDPRAVTGGCLGSAFQALRIGCSRGVFTNEAGMGTASIAHGGAKVKHPCQQGLMGIMEVFLDTIVICTLTALVILVSGASIPYGKDAGAELTGRAFACVLGEGACIWIGGALILFALGAILGWGLYGARCAQYLFGDRAWTVFAAAQSVMVALSAVMKTDTAWQLSELFNGLMVIPNLITLAALTPELCRLTKEYRKSGETVTGGGSFYADFHQCKPL